LEAQVAHSQRGQRGSGKSESRDILGRTPWLREIGRWVRAGYDVVDPSVPPHLAALLTEAGYTAHEIAARSGHATLDEVSRYTKAVDQERLARNAMEREQTGTQSVKPDRARVSKPLM